MTAEHGPDRTAPPQPGKAFAGAAGAGASSAGGAPSPAPDGPSSPVGAPSSGVLQSGLAPQLQAVLLAAGLVGAVLVFQKLATLVLLVLVTVLMALPLAFFASWLGRYRVPRALGVLAGLVLALAVLAGVLALLIPPTAEELERLAEQAPETVETLTDQYAVLAGDRAADAGTQVQRLVDRFLAEPLAILTPLPSFGLGVAGVALTTILVLLTAYYIAVRPEPLVDGVLKLFPPARRAWAWHVMSRLRVAWVGWLKGVVVQMLATGVLLYIGLTLAGVELALLFSVFSALLGVVPLLGSIVGGLPPILFALTESPERALVVLVIYIAVQQIEGNLIIPLVMSQTVRLHPAVIAPGVVAVGALFGVVGLFVAVPILSTVQTVLDELWVRPAERAHDRPDSSQRARLPHVPSPGETERAGVASSSSP